MSWVSVLRKREIVLAITIICSISMILEYFTTIPSGSSMLMNWAVYITAFAMAIGIVAILRLHLGYIAKKTPGQWFYSLWLLGILVVMTAFGLYGEITTANAVNNPVYNWLMNNVYSTLAVAQYGITGFYIFSAGFKSLRARNLESLLMVLACFAVIMYNITVPEAVWSGFPAIGGWAFQTGSVGALRGVSISAGLGAIAFGIRVLLGKERGYPPE